MPTTGQHHRSNVCAASADRSTLALGTTNSRGTHPVAKFLVILGIAFGTLAAASAPGAAIDGCCRVRCAFNLVQICIDAGDNETCLASCGEACGELNYGSCIGVEGGVATCLAGYAVLDCTAGGEGCLPHCGTFTPTATPTATATVTGTATETPTPVPQGGGCSDTAQCVPGLFCADGVCCDSACDQPLEQCNLPGHAGTCTATAAEAPAMSRTGLLAAAALLIGIAALALGRRLRRG